MWHPWIRRVTAATAAVAIAMSGRVGFTASVRDADVAVSQMGFLLRLRGFTAYYHVYVDLLLTTTST
jgi:hypothetical protein